MSAIPLINGHLYSWSSIEFSVNGIKFPRVKSINYKASLKPAKLYGTMAEPLGRTRGKSEPEASFEIYAEDYDALVAQLGSATVGFGEVPFTITINYSEIGSPVITDRIEGARITGVDKGYSEGTDALTVKCDLDVMRIFFNEIPIVSPVANQP